MDGLFVKTSDWHRRMPKQRKRGDKLLRGKYNKLAQALGHLRANDDRGGVVVRPLPSPT